MSGNIPEPEWFIFRPNELGIDYPTMMEEMDGGTPDYEVLTRGSFSTQPRERFIVLRGTLIIVATSQTSSTCATRDVVSIMSMVRIDASWRG
jgi:hypothetical protein